ncbi:MAG: hypothetical protein Q9180_007850, partial [Flavoplaca navasiana]
RRLHPYMPHLINVRKRSRAHHRAELRCLDFSVGHLLSSKSCKLEQDMTRSEEIHEDVSVHLDTIASEAIPRMSPSEEDFIRSFMDNIPSEVDRRVLIVEDLSDTLMYILGSCLNITPEVFEEHLLKSGWHDNTYEDREPDMWSTRNLTKNYVSIRWHRPIKGILSRPCEEQASEDLLTPQTTPDSWEENSSPQRRILHSTDPAVNLLRRPWEFLRSSVDTGAIVLVLLDPLPTVRHRVKILGKPILAQTRKPSRFIAEDSESVTEGHRRQDPEGGRTSRNQVRHSIVSRITSRNSNDFDLHSFRSNRSSTTPGTEPSVEERLQGSQASTVPEDDRPRVLEKKKNLCLFNASVNRLPILEYKDLFSSEKEYLLNARDFQISTGSILEDLIYSNDAQPVGPSAKFAPLDYLLMIILQDTLTILRSINACLIDMDDRMLDDEILQSSIDVWRRDLNRIESELRYSEASIPEFARKGYHDL